VEVEDGGEALPVPVEEYLRVAAASPAVAVAETADLLGVAHPAEQVLTIKSMLQMTSPKIVVR
jgi:hypothetical protein